MVPAEGVCEGEVLRPAGTGWWSLAKPMSAALIVLVFAFYALLHDLGR